MAKFNDLPIRFKLSVLLGASAAIALLISSLLILYYTFDAVRGDSLRHLRQLAALGSENLTAAVAFQDKDSATRMLSAIRLNPRILAAEIRNDQGELFARHVSDLTPQYELDAILSELTGRIRQQHSLIGMPGRSLDGWQPGFMYSVSPIVLEDKVIGSLILVSDTEEIRRKMLDYLLIQLLISAFTLTAIFLISLRLQRVFTRPILELVNTMRLIADTRNYSLSHECSHKDEFGVLNGHFNSMLAEIRSRDEQLERLAITDPLTDLANRRQCMTVMKQMVAQALRHRTSLGVIALDVDFFKRINDNHGHPAGDAVLRHVASLLAAQIREIDLAARIGGEEFLVLCDGGDIDSTCAMAERIRASIEQAVIELDPGKQLGVTISAGVYAGVPASGDIEPYLKAADAALYRAKRQGRNRVESQCEASAP